MFLCLNIDLNSCRTCDAMWYGAIRYDAIHPGPVPISSQIPLYHRYHVTCSFPGLVRYTYKKIGNLKRFIVKFIRRSDSLKSLEIDLNLGCVLVQLSYSGLTPAMYSGHHVLVIESNKRIPHSTLGFI